MCRTPVVKCGPCLVFYKLKLWKATHFSLLIFDILEALFEAYWGYPVQQGFYHGTLSDTNGFFIIGFSVRQEANILLGSQPPTSLRKSGRVWIGSTCFCRCPGCVIEKALDRPPVLQDAVQFFKSYGISDFSLTSGSLVRNMDLCPVVSV